MAEVDEIPEWVEELCLTLGDTIEWKTPACVDWYFERADKNEMGMDVVHMYPTPVEIIEAGPKDGEMVFPKVGNFDILAAQEALNEVEEAWLVLEIEDQLSVSLKGKYKGHEVLVIIYFQPC